MTRSRENDPEAGLLRMLRAALRAGLAPEADHEAFAMTRSAAQIIGLRGLEGALDALDPHRGGEWPGPARELVDFIERLSAEQDLSAFRAADADLSTRAVALRDWRAETAPEPGAGASPEDGAVAAASAAPEPPADALTVGEALAELPLSGDGGTRRAHGVRLMPQVATALRASLEWISGDPDHPRPFRLRAEDSLLEVLCEGVRPEGLAAAHEALAAAGGNLSPLGEAGPRSSAGVWIVRVPAWSPRPVHLMLQQGELRLAVPWHAVLRLSLVPSIEIEMRGGTLATPVLAPLVPLGEGIGERPVVSIAHGVKRALLVADHLVWRLGADDCDPPGPPPVAGLTRTVCSDDDETFWVADPGWLLAEVALPPLPQPGPARKEKPAAEPRAPQAAPSPAPPPAPSPAPPAELEALVELSAVDVEPLALTVADVEPLEVHAAAVPVLDAVAVSAIAAAPGPASEPAQLLPDWLERFGTTGGPGRSAPATGVSTQPRPGGASVLIAEDSIVASHFLRRLLEQRGFTVQSVETAAGLRAAAGERNWSAVYVDVELPDARGHALLDDLRAALDARGVPLVALVRDDEDAGLATDCGVRRWLRKPFDVEEVDHLLSRLGLLGEERS